MSGETGGIPGFGSAGVGSTSAATFFEPEVENTIVAETGSYAITGGDTSLVKPGAPLVAEAGSYLITGYDATLRYKHFSRVSGQFVNIDTQFRDVEDE